MSAIHMALRCARCKARLTIENAHVRADGVACYCVACVAPKAPAPATPEKQAEPAQAQRTCVTCAAPLADGTRDLCGPCGNALLASPESTDRASASASAPAEKIAIAKAKREKIGATDGQVSGFGILMPVESK